MKLYELDTKTWVRLVPEEITIPPGAFAPDYSQKYYYTHVDGMYAPVKGEDNHTYYFAAWTEVEVVPAP